MNPVEEYYNKHIEDEDKRLDYNIFEIPLTIRYITKYLKPGSKILDIACGTGKYAIELLKKGYKLGINDLSEKNINLALERIEGHINLLHVDNKEALQSEIWQKESWDAILLLGPLYHTIEKSERTEIIEKSKASIREGGYIFSAFMARSAALVFGLKHCPEGIKHSDGVKMLWEKGTDNTFVEATKWFTNAYFSFPEEINPFIASTGLNPLHLIGIEGIFGENMHLFHELDADLQILWKEFIFDNCENKHMVANSKHLLSIAQKM